MNAKKWFEENKLEPFHKTPTYEDMEEYAGLKKNIRIWHISDTHGMHEQLNVPDYSNYEVIIHTGDCSNSSNSAKSSQEIWKFIEWFSKIPGKKIYVPGNHDTAICRKLITEKEFSRNDIVLLIDKEHVYNGIKIYGSPWTPEFCGWSFMRARYKMDVIWNNIPEGTTILATHGPAKSILDLTETREHTLKQCGDKSLYNAIQAKGVKYHLFGHIHDYEWCSNQGAIQRGRTIYSNGSCVTDGKFDNGLSSHGNIIKIKL